MKISPNNINQNLLSTPSNQGGAVLIVVLLFLVLISLVGVMAVKSSATDLKLATSDQINTVLLQSADSVNNQIEVTANKESTSTEYIQMVESQTGILGHYTSDQTQATSKDKISFCYRPRDRFFTKDEAVIERDSGMLQSHNEGFCDTKNGNDFNTSRGTTITQVRIRNLGKGAYKKDFQHVSQGSDATKNGAIKRMFDVHTTSVLPAYGEADATQVNECFKKDPSLRADNTTGLLSCMQTNNIPSKTLLEQVELQNNQTPEFCRYFGVKANSEATGNCT